MLAQGFFDSAPHLEFFLQFFELSTEVAFAKAAFDTLRIRDLSRVLGRGCNKADISEEKRLFTEWGPGIQ